MRKNSPVSVKYEKDAHKRKSVPFFCLTMYYYINIVVIKHLIVCQSRTEHREVNGQSMLLLLFLNYSS